MNLEITKTMGEGFHVKDLDDGERCFQSCSKLCEYLRCILGKMEIDDEVTLQGD
jgi:hypothetical protein